MRLYISIVLTVIAGLLGYLAYEAAAIRFQVRSIAFQLIDLPRGR